VNKKFVVTLEIEFDPTERDGTDRIIGNPWSWNFSHLLSAGSVHVLASVESAYEACCESAIEWFNTPYDQRYIKIFDSCHHDETCHNYIPIEEDEDGKQ